MRTPTGVSRALVARLGVDAGQGQDMHGTRALISHALGCAYMHANAWVTDQEALRMSTPSNTRAIGRLYLMLRAPAGSCAWTNVHLTWSWKFQARHPNGGSATGCST